MSDNNFSIQDFKNWISEQKELNNFFTMGFNKENPYEKYIGREVKTKVSKEKLLERVKTEDDAETVISDFVESGGTVLLVEEKRLQIEVDSGIFSIPRFCVKIKKDD